MDDPIIAVEKIKLAQARLDEALSLVLERQAELESDLDELAEHKLRLLAVKLTEEIRENFWNSIKRGLFIAALLASVATAGGLLTVSDALKNRVDAAVEGKQAEIAKLREGIVNSLVDVKVRAEVATRDVDQLRAKVEIATSEVATLRKKVTEEADRAVVSIGGDVKGVATKLESYQVALKDTQRKLEESQSLAQRTQADLNIQLDKIQASLSATQRQSAATAKVVGRLDIKSAQESLKKMNQYIGKVDGVAGYSTRAAVMRFQKENLLPQTGDLDDATSQAITQKASLFLTE